MVSLPTTEDVASVRWHLQGILDGVGEAVTREGKVLEHTKGIILQAKPMKF